jgi:hypothetical protein
MFHRHHITRILQLGACGAALLLCTTSGKAEPKKKRAGPSKACASAYESAKQREESAHLREARESFMACATAACGKLQKACDAGSARLESDIPTIIPVVTDSSGGGRVDVVVKMDGELVASRLDGRGVAVDPGLHEFSFSTTNGVFARQNIMIAQGQKNRQIALKLAAASEPAAAPPPEAAPAAEKPAPEPMSSPASPPPAAADMTATEDTSDGKGSAWPYVIGGAGLAAIGTGALLTIWGNKDNDKLDQCTPQCAPASVDHVKSLYTTANVLFGVGIVALGTATYLYVDSRTSKEKAPSQSAYVFDVQPTPSGAFASVAGSF